MYKIFRRCFQGRAIRSNRETTLHANHLHLALELLESREMLAANVFEVSGAVDLQALTAWAESQNSIALVVVSCDHRHHSMHDQQIWLQFVGGTSNAGQETAVPAKGIGEETTGEIGLGSIVFALEGETSSAAFPEILKAIGVDDWYSLDTCDHDSANGQIDATTTKHDATDQLSSTTDVAAETNSDQSRPTAVAEPVNQKQNSSVRNAVAVVDVRQNNVPSIPVVPKPLKIGLRMISLAGPADDVKLPARLTASSASDRARPRYFASHQPNEKLEIENRLTAGLLDHHQSFTLIEPFEHAHTTIKRPELKQTEKVQNVPEVRELQTDKPTLLETSSISIPVSLIQFAYHPSKMAEAVWDYANLGDQRPIDRQPNADEAVLSLTSVAAVENLSTKPNDEHLVNSTISTLVVCGMLTESHLLRRPTKNGPGARSLQKD